MIAFLFSCEHATCAVPEAYRDLFRGSEDIVTSTRGWDPGALNLAQGFSMKFRTPLVHADVTRLLIDVEQSGDDRWSEFSLKLPETNRAKLEDRHERAYRANLQQRINEDFQRHTVVLHLMVHTEPSDGAVILETAPGNDVGEKFAEKWRDRLAATGLDIRHICNADSSPLAKHLAKIYPADRYAGIRLRVPQSYFLEGKPLRWDTLKKALLTSLSQVSEDLKISLAPEVPLSD
jgi:hypothetical protein